MSKVRVCIVVRVSARARPAFPPTILHSSFRPIIMRFSARSHAPTPPLSRTITIWYDEHNNMMYKSPSRLRTNPLHSGSYYWLCSRVTPPSPLRPVSWDHTSPPPHNHVVSVLMVLYGSTQAASYIHTWWRRISHPSFCCLLITYIAL